MYPILKLMLKDLSITRGFACDLTSSGAEFKKMSYARFQWTEYTSKSCCSFMHPVLGNPVTGSRNISFAYRWSCVTGEFLPINVIWMLVIGSKRPANVPVATVRIVTSSTLFTACDFDRRVGRQVRLCLPYHGFSLSTGSIDSPRVVRDFQILNNRYLYLPKSDYLRLFPEQVAIRTLWVDEQYQTARPKEFFSKASILTGLH